MDTMEFLDGLSPLLRTYWFIALPTSLIFIIQTIVTFIGADATDGLEADFDSDLTGGDAPLQIFSLRNLINFLLGFSWAGISLYSSFSNPITLIAISFLVGCVFVALFFIVIRQLKKLSEDNSFKFSDVVGKSAEVYFSIPANKNGKGKVLISVGGSFRELDAITENDKIETGAIVTVKRVENNSLLIVEKI